jgi:spermidine/putrescine transport system ATP-binding protein
LVLRDVTKSFGDVRAVDGVELTIDRGEFVTLLGPSGCGKTTLLRIVAGLERPDRGLIKIAGQDSSSVPPERRPVNYVFQNYALFPHLDVFGNVQFGLKVARTPHAEMFERVSTAISMVRLDGLESRRVDQLSGGQQQRVALARAIVNRPEILLLDEPLGALDLKLRKEMQLELRMLHRRLGGTFIYVTHDQEEALAMSDRVVVMRSGQVIQDGTPEKIYRDPQSRFVAEFIGETNVISAAVAETVTRAQNLDWNLTNQAASTDEVTISVRPEHLNLADQPGERRQDQVYVEGELLDSIFLGPFYRHLVQLEDASVVVVQELAVEERKIEIGAQVTVFWSPADMTVLPS